MNRKLLLMTVLLLAIMIPTSALAIDLPDAFDEPCIGGMGILADICTVVNLLHVEQHSQNVRITDNENNISGNVVDIATLNSTQNQIISDLNQTETDITNLQTTDISLQTQITNNDIDILALQNSDITIQTTTTSLDTRVTDLENQPQMTQTYIVEDIGVLPNHLTSVSLEPTCNSGDVLLSGGYDVGGIQEIRITNLSPNIVTQSFAVTFEAAILEAVPINVSAYALCQVQ